MYEAFVAHENLKKSYEPTRYFEHKQASPNFFNNISLRSQSHIMMHTSDNSKPLASGEIVSDCGGVGSH